MYFFRVIKIVNMSSEEHVFIKKTVKRQVFLDIFTIVYYNIAMKKKANFSKGNAGEGSLP